MPSLKKKISYSLGANLISLLISLFTSIGIPKLMADSVDQYGKFQIFVFYAGYIGFLHFGLCDGIILRVAGKSYGELDKSLYSGMFRLLLAFEVAMGLFIGGIGRVFTGDVSYQFILAFIGLNCAIVIPKLMLLNVLQVTGRIQEYSIILLMGRLAFLALVILGMGLNIQRFEYFVLSQTLGEGMAFIGALVYCRDLIGSRPAQRGLCIGEMRENISVGYMLLISNILTLLFVGIHRIFIQARYDVEVYGKVSFSFVILNMVLTLISSIEIVLYPEFKRKTKKDIVNIYQTIDAFMMSLIFLGLSLYYPFFRILKGFLPQYADSLTYMAFLLPSCAFSSKFNLLVHNDMKVYRMEKDILRVNIATVVLSLVFFAVFTILGYDLKLIMLSISAEYMFRCVYAEWKLNGSIRVFSLRRNLCDLFISLVFILCMGYFPSLRASGIYVVCFVVYVLIRNIGGKSGKKI